MRSGIFMLDPVVNVENFLDNSYSMEYNMKGLINVGGSALTLSITIPTRSKKWILQIMVR